jgi:hypothetical protein
MASEPRFRPLPIEPDEGFPQAFLLSFLDATFIMSFHVNIAEDAQPDGNGLYELPGKGAFMVLTVSQHLQAGPAILMRRKLVRHQILEAGAMLLRFTRLSVARLNINGVGAFGSVVEGEVAARWAS